MKPTAPRNIRRNIKMLQVYLKYTSNKETIKQITKIIELYEERKIEKYKTALNVITLLTSNHQKVIESGKAEKLYNEIIRTKENSKPVTGRLKNITYKPTIKVSNDSTQPSVRRNVRLNFDGDVINVITIIDEPANRPEDNIKQLITVHPIDSVFDNLTLEEEVNVDRLLKSDLLQTVKYENYMHENERHHVEQFRKFIGCDGISKTTYKFANGIKYGRVYCKDNLGAITLRKEVRGTIYSDKYVDVDIANCHPCMIYQIAKAMGVDCSRLEKYVNNRKELLEQVQWYYGVDRDTAKNLFIRILYLGTFKNWAINNKIKKPILPFIEELKTEFNALANTLIKKQPQTL